MRPVSTYSLCACDLERGEWGVAVQSKFLAVGSIVSWAEAEVGCVATQAWANPRYGPEGLALLREGRTADEVVQALVVDGVEDVAVLKEAHRAGRPVAVRCADEAAVRRALARPEVSCALVPPSRRDLLDLDLRRLTYG